MAVLTRGESIVDSVFGIHGDGEDDMSAGLAYLLAQSDTLLLELVKDLLPGAKAETADTIVRMQTSRTGEGITDVEIAISGKAFIVIEVKKGATPPAFEQMAKYSLRCKASGCKHALLVALTAIERAPALAAIGVRDVKGVRIDARSWRWLRRLLKRAGAREKSSHTRRLISEYRTYLEDFMGNDRAYSNLTYVVALAKGNPEGWDIGWIDVVRKRKQYFYPAGKNWPPPPNYIGFRFDGQLQTVHHVTSFKVVADLRDHIRGSERGGDWGGDYYLLKLGPAMKPPHVVRTGNRIHRSARVWCMLDTLFTSDTLSDALTETEKRRAAAL